MSLQSLDSFTGYCAAIWYYGDHRYKENLTPFTPGWDDFAAEAWERMTHAGVDNYTIQFMKVRSLIQRGINALDRW